MNGAFSFLIIRAFHLAHCTWFAKIVLLGVFA